MAAKWVFMIKINTPMELEKMLYQKHKIMLVKQIKMYKIYGYRGYRIKMYNPNGVWKILYQKYKIILPNQRVEYKSYGHDRYIAKIYKPNGVWVRHPYTCRLQNDFFLHQKHKFGSLRPSRSTYTRHIEKGSNLYILGPHLYKISFPATSIFTQGRIYYFHFDFGSWIKEQGAFSFSNFILIFHFQFKKNSNKNFHFAFGFQLQYNIIKERARR